jgi:hypothetical protein
MEKHGQRIDGERDNVGLRGSLLKNGFVYNRFEES